ncbi:MAG TPA: hypothetical protein VFT22_31530 [Kofleriaceae bacterium]|nr:hypothetical protein [Kofleriaceae bacterium]
MSITRTPHAPEPRAPAHAQNTTDATRGEPLAVRAQKRRAELDAALQKLPPDELRARGDIELALSTVDGLLTGDVEKLSDATASGLSRWLEHTKHLAEVTTTTRRSAQD